MKVAQPVRLNDVQRVIAKCVDFMPTQADFIAQHCAADPVQFPARRT
ncbi:MAG: hypothetical protein RI949_350 [Pseudomonadota bacterium]|jgi:hypothetical protein